MKRICIYLFLLFVAACQSNDRTLEVAYKNFDTEIQLRQNLRFIFNRDVASEAQAFNEWLDTQYLDITPQVKGKCKWISAKELVFSPDSAFAPHTDYHLQFAPALLEGLGREGVALGKTTEMQVHTPFLKIEKAEAFWGANQQTLALLLARLTFNYPITAEQLRPLMHTHIGGQAVPFMIHSTEGPNSITIAIGSETPQAWLNKSITIDISPNASLEGAKHAALLKGEANIPGFDQLQVLAVQTGYVGSKPYIDVQTNQSLKADNLEAFVEVLPKPSNMRIEAKNGGFLIHGDFSPNTSYAVTTKEGMASVLGKTLPKSSRNQAVFATPQPVIAFAEEKGVYLTSQGKRRLGLRVAGLNDMQLVVYKIYENNIAHFMGQFAYSYSNGYGMDRYGDRILDVTLPVNELEEEAGLKLINLNFLEPHAINGFYVVFAYSASDRWVKDAKIVSISDIGLMAKQGEDELLVFANSLKTAEPLSGVQITLVSTNNQQVYTLPTNGKGVAVFSEISKKAPGFKVGMVTAHKGQEFNFLYLDQNRVNTYKFDVDGYREEKMQAFIYGDRKLYRPGDRVNFKAIVREKSWATPTPRPMEAKLRTPRWEEIGTQRLQLNAEGSLEGWFDIPADAPTGNYSILLYTANGRRVQEYDFDVEEFMPQRIKVALKASKEWADVSDSISANIEAYNLFGTPAANRRYDMAISIYPETLAPKGLEDFSFELANQRSYYNSIYKDGQTDSQGKATVGFTPMHLRYTANSPSINLNQPQGDWYEGLLNANIYASVFDENGRAVSRVTQVKLPTQPTFFGIGNIDYYVSTQQPLRVPLAVVNAKGELLSNVACQVQTIRHEWNNIVERLGNSFVYKSAKREVLVNEQTLTLNKAQTAYTFVPDLPGEYEIRVKHAKATTYTARHFYAYGKGAVASSFNIDKEGKIEMTADKEEYRVGETAKILVKMPFAGKMLFTAERDRVLDLREFADAERVTTVEVPITEAMLPNVYVSATVIKPIGDAAIPLTVAYGYLPLKVVRDDSKINVQLQAPERSRSNRRQTVKVRVDRPGAEVTVAVVDEGILQIKGYETPAPHDFFYQRRALEVASFSLYDKLLTDFQVGKHSYGAGEMLGNRVNPFSNRRVKALALWSGTLKADAKGEVQFSMELPQFSGQVRIMALAHKGIAFGHGEAKMIIADPIVVSSGLPRFASIGDEVTVPVLLANTENKTQEVAVSIDAGGLMQAIGDKTAKVTLAPNAEQFVFFKLKTGNKTGIGQVKVAAVAGGETFQQTTELPISVGSGLVKQHGYGSIEAGKSVTVTLGKDLMAGKSKLVVGQSPVVELGALLSNVMGYPHGCLEQTISKAFPQLYVADLLPYTADESASKEAKYYVTQAIGKLSTLQIYNGGFSYWQGGNTHLFGTAYAAHFLLEAQQAGYQPPQAMIDQALSYLRSHASVVTKLVKYRYRNEKGQLVTTDIVPKELVYSLYVLALSGKPLVSGMNIVKQFQYNLTNDSRYLLACTYLLAGDEKSYLQLLPEEFGKDRGERDLHNSFSSPLRDQALTLNALITAAPDNEQIGIIARQLSTELRQAGYISTQDASFALLSLGKLAKQVAASNAQVSVWAGGKKIGEGPTVELGKEWLGKSVELRAKDGRGFYFWEASGLSSTGKVKEEDKLMKVRRSFFTRDGAPITNLSVKQGDLLVVRITLEMSARSNMPPADAQVLSDQRVSNVVVTDMLPAGLEIENPRLGVLPDIDWIKDATDPEYTDFRDDRVNFFVDAQPRPQHFYYVVRAVSKGKFKLGPVSADAMYSGEYHSYHGAGSFVVE